MAKKPGPCAATRHKTMTERKPRPMTGLRDRDNDRGREPDGDRDDRR